MSNMGAAIAIVGIWVSVGMVAMSGQELGLLSIAAMFATLVVLLYLRD
jgi:hypothetical protein